ncbi:MAG: efflux RND transporter periplasmic adaptor subunit [Deltaproteobacteria bacterium]|nr:efflux RND transporter periplasmic adaptor subunit [Deltaproteobacteria bacterium]
MSDDIEIPAAPAPKKRPARAGLVVAAAAVLLVAAGGGAWYAGLFGSRGTEKTIAGKAEQYTCGMHPWIISDKPGECPICGMKLTKIEEQPAAATPAAPKSEADEFFSDAGGSAPEKTAAKGERKLLFYRNPMNPAVTSPTPAKDEMGMDYVPVYSDEVGAPAAGGGVEGLATIRVGEEALRLSGVQTASATRETVRRTVRTVGIVVPDETRIRHVHTKIEGWVEKLYTNFTGEVVRQGQPILSLYSPELLATQEEFLKAKETAAKFAGSRSPDVRSLGEELQHSARRRLELFDVPKSFIAQLEKTGAIQRSVTLNAPTSGFVTAKDVFEGQKVEPGMELFSVTDLSRVWIEADLYEYEAGAVKVGQEATLALAFQPGVQLKGRVAFVFPYLSPETRTLKVRFEFPNPNMVLKPQMYADVTLSLAAAQGVTIPDSAMIDTGVRKVVFVETSPGSFEPREVKVGVRGEGKAQVLAGVKEGEKVVVKANFLLDSESRLRAALTKMSGGAR